MIEVSNFLLDVSQSRRLSNGWRHSQQLRGHGLAGHSICSSCVAQYVLNIRGSILAASPGCHHAIGQIPFYLKEVNKLKQSASKCKHLLTFSDLGVVTS